MRFQFLSLFVLPFVLLASSAEDQISSTDAQLSSQLDLSLEQSGVMGEESISEESEYVDRSDPSVLENRIYPDENEGGFERKLWDFRTSYDCSCSSCSCGKGCSRTCCSTCYYYYSYCTAGRYNNPNYVPDGSSCRACPGGQYQNSGSQTSCKACPAGYYCPSGATIYINCPSGYYCPSSSSTYISCPAGRYSPAIRQSACTYCSAGTYQNSATQTSCKTCPAGSYCPSAGSTGYTTCPAGYYCPSGSSSAKSCSEGTYCPSGASIYINCAAGQYNPTTLQSACIDCPGGQYTGSTGQTSCSGCPQGSYCPTGSTAIRSCAAGTYSSSSAALCTDCAAGKFQGSTGQTSCSNCAIGKYSAAGASSCTSCATGKYQSATGQSSCTSCPAGYYCATTGLSAFTACAVGKYAASTGTVSCSSCAAGRYQENTGETSCTACDAGSYCASTGLSAVTSCASGKYSDAGASACTSCAAGKYQGSTGQTSCIDCPAGYYCATTGLSIGTACAVGYYTATTGASACTTCAAGTYAPSTGTSSCTTCPAGRYCATSGLSVAAPCFKGSYSAAGSIGCSSCAAGQYAASTGSSSCTACAAGRYQADIAETACDICPVCTFSASESGSTSCTACPGTSCSEAGSGSEDYCYYPSTNPTPLPTTLPSTSFPSFTPTPAPSPIPRGQPSQLPTLVPTSLPTLPPTPAPSVPTLVPTPLPTATPTSIPSAAPTPLPSGAPTPIPSPLPSSVPTPLPSAVPTALPSPLPTLPPSPVPTSLPTLSPTPLPTYTPTPVPTHIPTLSDSMSVEVEMFITVDTEDEPTSAQKEALQDTIAETIGVNYDDIFSLDIDTSRRRLLKSDQSTARKLLDSASWGVTFTVRASESATGFDNAADFSAAILLDLATDSFAETLSAQMLITAVVDSVSASALTPSDPSFNPTPYPTVLPSFFPTPIPEKKKSAGQTDAASSGVILIGGAAMGVIIVGISLIFYSQRKAARNKNELERLDSITSGEGDDWFERQHSFKARRLSRTNSFSDKDLPNWIIPPGSLKLEKDAFARGGGGQIFRGKYMGHTIAAKQLFSGLDAEDHREEFDREVQTLAKLSHPCILSFFGTCEDQSSLYMVMEFCGGGTLSSYYMQPKFDDAEFVRIMNELFGAITYLHQREIAHRDLKPENILLETKTNRVKVADFGLAKSKNTTMTMGIGTPAYMAPELFKDDEDLTEPLKLDVYAIGIIMWELWTRTKPFFGRNVHYVVTKVIDGQRPNMIKVETRPEMPEFLLNLTNKCWADDVKDRPDVEQAGEQFEFESKQLAPEGAEESGSTAHGMEGGIMMTSATPTQHIKKVKKNDAASVESFLQSANLGKYSAALIENGFADMESLCDREVLDDETLKNEINMTKLDIRKFRGAIETKGVSTTMLVARRNMQAMAADDNAKAKVQADSTPTMADTRGNRESLDFDDGALAGSTIVKPKGIAGSKPPMQKPKSISRDPSMTQRTLAKHVEGLDGEQVEGGTTI